MAISYGQAYPVWRHVCPTIYDLGLDTVDNSADVAADAQARIDDATKIAATSAQISVLQTQVDALIASLSTLNATVQTATLAYQDAVAAQDAAKTVLDLSIATSTNLHDVYVQNGDPTSYANWQGSLADQATAQTSYDSATSNVQTALSVKDAAAAEVIPVQSQYDDLHGQLGVQQGLYDLASSDLAWRVAHPITPTNYSPKVTVSRTLPTEFSILHEFLVQGASKVDRGAIGTFGVQQAFRCHHEVVTGPTQGTLSFSANGWQYVPGPSAASSAVGSTDTFTWRLVLNGQTSATASFTLTFA